MARPAHSWQARMIGAGVIGLVAAAAFAQPTALPWAIAALVGVVAWAGWRRWYDTRGPGAWLAELHAPWRALHGAQRTPTGVSLYDGTHPIDVRLSAARGHAPATVIAPLGEDTLAYRIWPDGVAPPAFGEGVIRTSLARAPGLEARFARVIRVETNDPERLARRIGGETLAPVLGALKDARGDFRGVTWDGQHLGVHWSGATARDPEHALAWSRRIRQALGDV